MTEPFYASFRVDGFPAGQPRPQAFIKARGTAHARAGVYDPKTADGWKGCVVLAGNPHRPPEPLLTPVRLTIILDMPRPGRLMRRTPDADNLAKAIMDAMTRDGWWRDDAQVVELAVQKRYHAKTGRAGASIAVAELEELEAVEPMALDLFTVATAGA
jgi:crossover junction endodeoxyribonuclease RusA